MILPSLVCHVSCYYLACRHTSCNCRVATSVGLHKKLQISVFGWFIKNWTYSHLINCFFNQHWKEFDETRRNLLANDLGITPPMGWNSWNHFKLQH
ncbi:unnamed protein product, partial [Vitis vinifera]|uniref:Uncharacterized protein n=1 Tax=Vitis vinifera TaxID=29760 RepID=D7TXW7_VITVI